MVGGVCVYSGGMHIGGACVAGSMYGKRVCMAGGSCVAGETATAADCTHPTGMHSCSTIPRLRLSK